MDGLFIGFLFLAGILISFFVVMKLYKSVSASSGKVTALLLSACVFVLTMGLLFILMLAYQSSQMRRVYPYGRDIDTSKVDSSQLDTFNKSNRTEPVTDTPKETSTKALKFNASERAQLKQSIDGH